MKYKIVYQERDVIIEKLPNGKFKKPSVSEFCKSCGSVTWLNDCKIPYKSNKDKESARFGTQTDIRGNAYGTNRPSEGHMLAKNVLSSEQGRFPANLLVSDDVLNNGKVTSSGVSKTKHLAYNGISNTGFLRGESSLLNQHSDSGSFSRYFDLDVWWQERFKKLPKDAQKTFPFLIVPKASKSEKNKGLGNLPIKDIPYSDYRENYDTTKSYVSEYPDGRKRPMNKMKNDHPTVKPIKLMSYLITLGSQKDDVILDPFVGSGTTAISCRLLDRNFIGFDTNPEYIKIAKARLTAYKRQKKLGDFCG